MSAPRSAISFVSRAATAPTPSTLPPGAYRALPQISADATAQYLRRLHATPRDSRSDRTGAELGPHQGRTSRAAWAGHFDPPAVNHRVIALVLRGQVMTANERRALEFAAGGFTLRLVPVLASALPSAGSDAGLDAVVSLGGEPHYLPGVPTLMFVDADGADMGQSAQVADTVIYNRATATIRLVDSLGSQLALGEMPRGATTAATEMRLWRAAGPLLVIGAATLPLPAAPPEAALRLDVPTPRRTLAAACALVWRVRSAAQNITRVSMPRHLQPANDGGEGIGLPSIAPNWTDPYIFRHRESTYAVVSEFDRGTRQRVIRLLAILGEQPAPLGVVLRANHHQVTPRVYRVGDRWLGTTGTTAPHNPIYTFDELGDPWRPATDLPALPPRLGHPLLVMATSEPGAGATRIIGVVGIDTTSDPLAVKVAFSLRGHHRWRRVDAAVRVDTGYPDLSHWVDPG